MQNSVSLLKAINITEILQKGRYAVRLFIKLRQFFMKVLNSVPKEIRNNDQPFPKEVQVYNPPECF